MRPRVARICEDICTAWAKSPVMCGERGDEEVAEAVALEVALVEAVLEEPGEQVLVFGEGDHAVADVAGGKHLEVFAEAAGGAAVVGDGDDGGEVADEAGSVVRRRGVAERRRASLAGCGDVALEAAQQGGEAGAAADGDDAQGCWARSECSRQGLRTTQRQ